MSPDWLWRVSETTFGSVYDHVRLGTQAGGIVGYPTSFTNEHSVEYVLVPDLVGALSRRFDTAVPSFFWLTREGGRLARESLAGRQVRVLTVFARRPKVCGADDPEIHVRFNPELFSASEVGAEMGSPVLAGVPLVRSIDQLRLGAPCSWFRVGPLDGASLATIDLVMAPDSRTHGSVPGIQSLGREDLLAVAEEARHMEWSEVVDFVRALRNPPDFYSGWWSRASYKPFHLFLLDNL